MDFRDQHENSLHPFYVNFPHHLGINPHAAIFRDGKYAEADMNEALDERDLNHGDVDEE